MRHEPSEPARPRALAVAAAAAGLLTALAAGPAAALAQTGGEEPTAATPLVTDRPDATESAAAVAPGRVQLEGGYTLTDDGSFMLHTLGEALFRIGVVEGAELRLGLSSFQAATGDASATGLTDASLGTKVVLRREASGATPRIALLADATLPTGGDEFGQNGTQPGGLLALGWDLAPSVGLGANVGYRYADSETGRFDEIRTSAALGIGLSEDTGVFLEAFADHRPAEERPSEVSLDGGLTHLLSPDFQLDARAGLLLNSATPFLGGGASVRW